ncbi:hypothetical protein A3J17_00115 [Candidatus Curtissbacteria bacterium RIFCSPLOWO2_02_FULL_40_11]|nr:MAG: hypothetical protein A3J17_00115 [Candidatus Curtissbacteria bacterium RIFCSPLOWO2_02_FULL_40_11]
MNLERRSENHGLQALGIYFDCCLYASRRFWKSEATVIGPIPPGTGEIAETILETSLKSTSPVSFIFGNSDSGFSNRPLEGRTLFWVVVLIPTSITTWSLLT